MGRRAHSALWMVLSQGGVPALEAEEGGHRAKSVQAAPGVADDHRGGQALSPVLDERSAGAFSVAV